MTRRHGIPHYPFKFHVQGTGPPFDEKDAEQFSSDLLEFDPSGYVDLTRELIAPGEVVECNGSNVDPETNRITWHPISSELSIHARSHVLNTWFILGGVAALLGLLGVLAGVLAAAVYYWKRNQTRV